MKDRIGLLCSGLCIVHCMATPIIVMLGLSGLIASLFSTEWVHLVLIVPVSLMLLTTLPTAYQRRGGISSIVIGLLGLVFLVLALFVNEDVETILTVIGGVLVMSYHITNLRVKHTESQRPLRPQITP